ncbi:hypothetical protein BDM02DRAFT_598699 [Thelephora ganbajun]|uniref:Uncharacterized protein n=1 Tax=Thelephora ganbajun TaxID=370292 RepID=A0ACB6Z704_THEGA|nr:hypothetical protein BDM02DRAFT_598699 [Thelephora ganbajun]
MNVDEGEPHFEGEAIFNALENAVQRRRNKRKRSNEDPRLSPRYYRHLLAPQHSAGSGVDNDGDAVMGGPTNQSIREESLEAGEIAEVPPCTDYDMKVLSREPRTSEEKTTFAKNLLYIFTEAAVAVDRSRKAEKRYEDYKKSQEARIYNYPSHDARQVLMAKLQTLRMSSHEESECLTRVIADLGALPSCHLSDVVAYNEHNHLTDETLAEEKRKAAIDEMEKRMNERHDHVDQNLLTLQARLEELTKEKQARKILRDFPPPVDPNEMAVDEATIVHQANVQRVVAVEASVQTITSAESIPHRDGPIQTLEESLPTTDSQATQLQEFAIGLAKLIKQVPVVRGEIDVIKAENVQRKEAEKAVGVDLCWCAYLVLTPVSARGECEGARPAPGDFLCTARSP